MLESKLGSDEASGISAAYGSFSEPASPQKLRLAVVVLAVLNSVDLYLPIYIENTSESDTVLPASQGLRVALLQVSHGLIAHLCRCAACAARQYRPSPSGTTM